VKQDTAESRPTGPTLVCLVSESESQAGTSEFVGDSQACHKMLFSSGAPIFR